MCRRLMFTALVSTLCLISNGEPLWIGESTDELNSAMSGDIDDIRIFAKALTEAAIAAID
jgi:hypothetical protein